jgi:hypothetical protein
MCLLLYCLIIIPVKCYTESIILKVFCIFISDRCHIFTFVKRNLEKCLTFTLRSFVYRLVWGLSWWSILTKHCYWNFLINFKMNRASQDCPCTSEDLNESCVYTVAHLKVSSSHFVLCGAISMEYIGSIPVEN